MSTGNFPNNQLPNRPKTNEKENAKMDFGEVFSKAWKIIWKYKILWLFGIFASCSGGGAGLGGVVRACNTREIITGITTT
jgi:hypothetical protein